MRASCPLWLLGCLLLELLGPLSLARVEAQSVLTDDEIEEFLQGFLRKVDSEKEEDAEEQGAEKVAPGEELPENPGRLNPSGKDSSLAEEG
ncbi:adipocyte enhancer-binding protein 1-like [Sphaerodactylus townsendi]|uniref:adipocyte enhancer-binding protein 1-like n=1 Tax=Sphaerodactylus townsendi TaxID=933632 RepID=UPI002026B6FE|nr:adipocyte enhancer-binding protein 1-like [Sphaerodactylus townsendi]